MRLSATLVTSTFEIDMAWLDEKSGAKKSQYQAIGRSLHVRRRPLDFEFSQKAAWLTSAVRQGTRRL